MPFVVVNVVEEQVQELQSSFAGHDVIKHVGKLFSCRGECWLIL